MMYWPSSANTKTEPYKKTMVYEISMLPGCLATEEQALEILGSKEIEFED